MRSDIRTDERGSLLTDETRTTYTIEVAATDSDRAIRLKLSTYAGDLRRCHLKSGGFSHHTDEGDLEGLVDELEAELEALFPGVMARDGSLGQRIVEAARHAVDLARSHDDIPVD